MRVTSETMVMRSLDRLQSRLETYDASQRRLASGKRINVPSDDPAVARRSMSLRGEMRTREQQARNADDARGWLDAADHQLQTAWTRLQRVRELAARGGTTTDARERVTLANEVRQLQDEIVSIANAELHGRPLFGGFTDDAAVTADPGGTPEWTFAGDGDEVTRRIGPDDVVRVNVTAAEWLGHDAGAPGGDLLTTLDRVVTSLTAESPGETSALLDEIDAAAARIGDTLATIGATGNRVASTQQRLQDALHQLRADLSTVEDVDLAEGIMELQTQQVAYEATLQAIGRALPPSLAAFLR